MSTIWQMVDIWPCKAGTSLEEDKMQLKHQKLQKKQNVMQNGTI
jgi:hypothetical protein